MPDIQFDYSSIPFSYQSTSDQTLYLDKELEEQKQFKNDLYQNPRASLFLPFDQNSSSKAEKCANAYNHCDVMVIFGIGGSNLGTLALIHSLHGFSPRYNNKYIYFCDTVDSGMLTNFIETLHEHIEKGRSIVFNVISKSGSTIETMTNFSILWNTFNSSTYASKVSVVVTTDKGSPLWDFAQRQQMDSLAIPACVGGRFSVFSAVGLFPLFWIGFNVKDILDGAQAAITDNFNNAHETNHARQMALIKYYAYQNNHHILNMFTFSPLLESFGKWYRQLIGESIPKKRSNGQPTPGITPMVSIGTTDLHSVSQLFLAGPNDKLHVFISNEAKIKDMQIPNSSAIEALCPIIANQSIDNIMKSITKGVKSAFDQRTLPVFHSNYLDLHLM